MSLDSKLQQSEKAVDRLVRQKERELTRAYKESLLVIRKELALAYEKHAIEGKLTQVEMAKYNRLANLEKSISDELTRLNSKEIKTTRSALVATYQESYYRTAYALESTAQAKLGYGLLSTKAIEKAVTSPFDPIGWNQRIRDNTRLANRKIREEIAKGLIQGKAYSDVAKEVTKRMNIEAEKALTIVRTETHRVQATATLDSFEQASSAGVILKKVWVSTLDGRTREDHQSMDGVKVGLDEEFILPDGSTAEAPGLTGIPEQDIRCRCTIRAEIEGYEPNLRRARGEGVIPYKTYAEWAENRL